MNKSVVIDGMKCGHCAGRVKEALNSIEGVISSEINLNEKTATLTLSHDITNIAIVYAVSEAGYNVAEIK